MAGYAAQNGYVVILGAWEQCFSALFRRMVSFFGEGQLFAYAWSDARIALNSRLRWQVGGFRSMPSIYSEEAWRIEHVELKVIDKLS